MYRQETCLTAACDDCRADFDTESDDYPGVIHFTDQADAERMLADSGWRVRSGGRLTCRRCAASQDCAAYGHQWDPWRSCLCERTVGCRLPDHPAAPDGNCTQQHRWCDRCLAREERPATATQQATGSEVAG